jgi:uncharacterized damage-inducible protein DinB
VSDAEEKQTLRRYLHYVREVLLWKLDGLSDYDIRRPMTPTGTNLLGLVKHCAAVESVYFGSVLDRPFPGQDELDWHQGDEAELAGDFYAAETESRTTVTDFYRRVWAHADAAIEELPLDARGTVRWWPEARRNPTLHTLLAHVIEEISRHAGQADIIREMIDGAAGLRADISNLPGQATPSAWQQHHAKLERIARAAAAAGGNGGGGNGGGGTSEAD